jgi:hypothetical protein
VAVPQPFRRDAYAELERLYRLHASALGRVDLKRVKEALAAYLTGHPEMLDPQGQANAMVEKYDERRRPPDDGQATMFDRDAFIPVGPNVRQRMGQARERDLIAWGQISTAEHASDAAAHARRMGYISSRLQTWTSGYTTLEEVERGAFGLGGP